jgi:hypothetical protein
VRDVLDEIELNFPVESGVEKVKVLTKKFAGF